MNPRKQLRVVSWNVGSAVEHTALILQLLVAQQPHVLCVQDRAPSMLCGLKLAHWDTLCTPRMEASLLVLF